MNKILGTLLLSGTLLMACAPAGEPATEDSQTDEVAAVDEVVEGFVDGTYTLEEANFGNTGWKESLEIVVEGGKIVDATWTSVDEEGLNKIEDENYQETMTKTDGLGPQDFIPALEDALVEAQNAEDVDVITGATGTAEKFKEYAQLLMDAALDGNSDTIIIENETNPEVEVEDDVTEEAVEDADETATADEPTSNEEVEEAVEAVEVDEYEDEDEEDSGNFGAVGG